MTKKYENRIIGSGIMNPADIKKHPQNWRKHPASQAAALDEVLGTVGWIQEVIINKTTGNLIDGHLRVETALKNKESEIPVKYVELTEDEERIALATFDPISALAEKDDKILKELLAQIESEDVDMERFFDEDVLPKVEHTEEELEAVPEVPKVAKTKPGDMYRLGEHVLMCGDSTVEEDVRKLMQGELADMVFTDPPYGVNVVGGGKNLVSGRILGDLTSTAIPFSFDLAVTVATTPIARFYFCGASSNLGLYDKLFNKYLNMLPNYLIWVKDNFTMKHTGYHAQYEIIYYGYKRGGGQIWCGGRTMDEASDVWRVKRDLASNYLHPTQKPIELPRRAIKNSSKEKDIVYDPFGGSGSTLIACEETGRKCRMMELAPEYCDVIVERWEKLTGKKAELITGE